MDDKDLIAAMAMIGLLAKHGSYDGIAYQAYQQAEAMLREREARDDNIE